MTVLLLLVVIGWQGGVSGAPLARALGVLTLYAALFMASLIKIWWTAGRSAAGWDQHGLWFQALHRFRPTRIAWESILAGGTKPDTRAYRLVVIKGDGARERFLNLAVIRNHHDFVAGLEQAFLERGFVAGRRGLSRPEWDQETDLIPG